MSTTSGAGPDVEAAAERTALAAATEAMRREIEAVEMASGRLDAGFLAAVRLVVACRGRVVVTGLGKSGHIGRKVAATLSSVGIPAHFVHATEALHGDSGSLVHGDVLVALSNSGRTAEVRAFAEYARHLEVPVVSIVGVVASPLADLADAVIDASVRQEADPLGLAPTASTTAALILGDALAAAAMAVSGFTASDFHARHPDGALGEQLATGEAEAR